MKTRIQHRDWLELAGEKIGRKQVGSVPTFLSVRQAENGLKIRILKQLFRTPAISRFRTSETSARILFLKTRDAATVPIR